MSIAMADTRVFEHAAGSTEIPLNPQRIASLQDHVLTMSLVELGAPVIASAGRTDDEGRPYLRGVYDLQGVDFHNSDIEFVGAYGSTDLEILASLNPDLIVTTHWETEQQLALLSKIAPTVALNQDQSLLAFMRDVADVSGTLDQYRARLERYHRLLDYSRTAIPNASDISVSVVLTRTGGELSYCASYGALTQVMDDLGLARPTIHSANMKDCVAISSEELPAVDADFILDTYGVSWGDTPDNARQGMAAVLPAWCQVLTACEQGRYIALPRTHVFSTSFYSLELVSHLLTSHIAGR